MPIHRICALKTTEENPRPRLLFGFITQFRSFPLHGSGGFGGDVIDDAIDMVHLIRNAV